MTWKYYIEKGQSLFQDLTHFLAASHSKESNSIQAIRYYRSLQTQESGLKLFRQKGPRKQFYKGTDFSKNSWEDIIEDSLPMDQKKMDLFIKLCKNPTEEFMKFFKHFAGNKDAVTKENLKGLAGALERGHQVEIFQEIANFIQIETSKEINPYSLDIFKIYYDPYSDKFNSGKIYP